MRLTLALFLCSLAFGCGTATRAQDTDNAASARSLAPVGQAGPPLVVGTTIDAATGRPIAASLTAPDGTRATSDAEGRFRLRLPLGTEGELVAETEDGRRGRVALRPLVGGELEVVLHLRR